MSYVKKKLHEFADRIDEILNENVWYVTELTQCPRKHYFRTKYPYLDLANIFNERIVLGIIIHKGIQDMIVESLNGSKVEIEKSIVRTFEIDGKVITLKGRVDILVDDKILYEIKTMNRFSGNIPEHYTKQIQIYLNLLNLDVGKLVIVNLDGASSKKFYTYDVKREEIDLEELLRKCINLEIEPMEWECKYCSYNLVCEKRIELQSSSPTQNI